MKKVTIKLLYLQKSFNRYFAGQHFHPTLQSSASFKHYDFEADYATAEEIIQKINLILQLKSSASRKEYLAVKERKHFRRKSSTNK